MGKLNMNTVVLRSFFRRKGQNRVLLVGILLSVMLLSSCVFGVCCGIAHRYTMFRQLYGDADMAVMDSERYNLAPFLQNTPGTEVFAQEVLYWAVGDPKYTSDDVAVARMGESFHRLGLQLEEGRLPAKEGEIVLEKKALSMLRLQARPGDTLVLQVSGWDGENAMLPEEKTFTLTGILQDKLSGWTAITYASSCLPLVWTAEDADPLPGSRFLLNQYMHLPTRVYGEILKEKEYWLSSRLAGEVIPVSMPLQYQFLGVFMYSWRGIVGLAALFLLLVGAVGLGISMAQAAALEKRRSQVGMLRAIGATGKQIRSILLREVWLMAGITLPLGMGLVLGALWGLGCLFPTLVTFYVPWPLVFVTAGMAVVFLLLSSLAPLRKATWVSPMQALRNINVLSRQRQLHAKTRLLFHPHRLLASRNMAFHRGRTIGMAALVCIGTLLVSFVGFFGCKMLREAEVLQDSNEPQYVVYNTQAVDYRFVNDRFGENYLGDMELYELEAIPYVAQVDSIRETRINVLVPFVSDYMTGREYGFSFDYLFSEPYYWKYLGRHDGPSIAYKQYRAFREAYSVEEEALNVSLYTLPAENLAQLLPYDGTIRMEEINAGREIVMVAPAYYMENMQVMDSGGYGSWVFSSTNREQVVSREVLDNVRGDAPPEVLENDVFMAGNPLQLLWLMTYEDSADEGFQPDDVVRKELTVQVGAVVNDGGGIVANEGRFCLITTTSGLAHMGLEAGCSEINVFIDGEPEDTQLYHISQEIRQIANRSSGAYLYDQYETTRDEKNKNQMLLLVAAGVLVLLFAFNAALVNSAIAGRITGDVYEIGTMRAVGASQQRIRASYSRQLWLLLGIGAGGALVIYGGVLVYFCTNHGLRAWNTPEFWIPWPLGYLLPLAAVCMGAIRARLKPICDKSIVDNIRVP